MTPNDDLAAEVGLRRLIEVAAEVEWQHARDILLGDAMTVLRADGCDGQLHRWACGKCDVIRRYEELMQPPARVVDAYRARFGDLGGAQP